MKCEICKKNEATVHLTEIINDQTTELHICQECAKAKGAQMQQNFGIADFLSGLVDLPSGVNKNKERISLKCESCGMTYANFKKLGRFGCENCYESFKRVLGPLLKKIHGTTRHAGKEPKEITSPSKGHGKKFVKAKTEIEKLNELKRRLDRAIKQEEFEEAAILRDKIRAMENKNEAE